MATRSERARYESERSGPKKVKRRRRPKGRHTEPIYAGTKTPFAHEAPASDGRRSRKSTRAGKNRLKGDPNFNLREERAVRDPEARARRESAKRVHPRGRA
jgi:hypothetical protein